MKRISHQISVSLIHSTLCFLLSTLSLHAAVPLRWTVETSRLQPAVFDVVRGETLALEASFQSYGKPVATSNMTAFLCWQTNGIASAWWVTNAVTSGNSASVLFTPDMDPGAPVVHAFLGLSDSTNSNNPTIQQSNNYRSAFTLRFRHGPGAVPNVIDMPPRILDLAHTIVINPPWRNYETVSNRAMKAVQIDDDVVTLNGLVLEGGLTVENETSIGFQSGGTLDSKLDAKANVSSLSAVATSGSYDDLSGTPDLSPVATSGSYDDLSGTPDLATVATSGSYDDLSGTPDLSPVATSGSYDDLSGTPDLAAVATSGSYDDLDDKPTAQSIGAYPAASGNTLAQQVATLNTGYNRLYNFSTGATNANFSATNYPPTAADAATRCHYQPEPGMDFSTVPASLQLNEYRDGAWRTVMDTRDWTVWYYRFKETQLTNEIARLKAENAVITNRLETAKAWANRTANGVENPMTDTLVVDRPNMWLMADYEWQKCVSGSNQCFVIRAKNVALSGGANTNGFLEICDAFGKPYMRVNKSAETFADPVFESISYDDDDGAWYIVYGNSTKPTKGGANAEIVGASSGGGKCILYGEDDPDCPATITWPESAESHAGHWIMKAVPKPVGGVVPSKMFFGAEIKVAGKDYVEYIKEASFGAGIRVGNNVYEAVESGNTLIWQKKVD